MNPQKPLRIDSMISTEEQFIYRSFYENLAERMTPQEINSINVLGEEFFGLVDQLALEIFIQRENECVLLGLTSEEFLWELQVFVNQFVRYACGTPLKIKGFCKSLKEELQHAAFKEDFFNTLHQCYLEHFYMVESESVHLV